MVYGFRVGLTNSRSGPLLVRIRRNDGVKNATIIVKRTKAALFRPIRFASAGGESTILGRGVTHVALKV